MSWVIEISVQCPGQSERIRFLGPDGRHCEESLNARRFLKRSKALEWVRKTFRSNPTIYKGWTGSVIETVYASVIEIDES